MNRRLLDVERARPATRLSSCTDLVPLPPGTCPDCGGATIAVAVAQPALFRHGGYGETTLSTLAVCAAPSCGRALTVSVTSIRPARRSAA